jgi:alkanesulfonate monooxygenase SsuD/methylene tetrahydromethanopterin reductase-like flavin-dependent oxidoreductase (luciferase family)
MTDRFVVTARELAAAQGLPDYPFVVVAHPIAGDTDDELRAKAERALDAIVSMLTTRHP